MSASARLRVVRSLARRVLCSISDSAAFLATVSSRAFLSPRCGTRRLTRLPRRSHSHSSTAAASGGSSGTRTSRGTTPRLAARADLRALRGSAAAGGCAAVDGLVGGHRVVAVDMALAEELLDELGGADVTDLVDDPAPLAPHPAAADEEHLYRCLELVFGHRDDVAVGAVGQGHGLLLQGALQGLDVVAQPGRPLVLLGGAGPAHLGFQPPDELARLARHEVAELLGQHPVLVLADPADAGGRALADVAEQARAASITGRACLNYSRPSRSFGIGEDAQQHVAPCRGWPTHASTGRSNGPRAAAPRA